MIILNITKELRIKLLDLTLNAFAKNPADCIGNHNESDNPMRNIWKISSICMKNRLNYCIYHKKSLSLQSIWWDVQKISTINHIINQ